MESRDLLGAGSGSETRSWVDGWFCLQGGCGRMGLCPLSHRAPLSAGENCSEATKTSVGKSCRAWSGGPSLMRRCVGKRESLLSLFFLSLDCKCGFGGVWGGNCRTDAAAEALRKTGRCDRGQSGTGGNETNNKKNINARRIGVCCLTSQDGRHGKGKMRGGGRR